MNMSSKALLALCLLQGTTAFSPLQTSTRPSTMLSVSPQQQEQQQQDFANTPRFSGAVPQTRQEAPIRRRESSSGSSSAPFYNQAARSNLGPERRNMYDNGAAPVTIQGGSLATLSLSSVLTERVQISLRTNGRPLNANVDLWHGPDNTPQTLSIYVEDGAERPFTAVLETPRGSNSLALRNTGQMEFPLTAMVEPEMRGNDQALLAVTRGLMQNSRPITIQGGAVRTFPFMPSVQSVQVLLTTDGRPLNARIELLQGPNNNKQVVECMSEDGSERPLFLLLETPGVGNVVRIVNTAPMEFPLQARVEPYLDDPNASDMGMGGADGWSFGGR